jgi:hypothetical protein
MAFDPNEFEEALKKTDTGNTFQIDEGVQNIKDQFLNMTQDERREAFSVMEKWSTEHGTKLSVDNSQDFTKGGTNFDIVAQRPDLARQVFGGTVLERKSH